MLSAKADLMRAACRRHDVAFTAAALQYPLRQTGLEAGRDAVFTFNSSIEDGWIVLGDSPGSGIVFDYDALRRHQVRRPGEALLPLQPLRRGEAHHRKTLPLRTSGA